MKKLLRFLLIFTFLTGFTASSNSYCDHKKISCISMIDGAATSTNTTIAKNAAPDIHPMYILSSLIN